MTKLDIAKKIIKDHYKEGDCGLFNTRNIVGDWMTTIYEDNDFTIDICYGWAYFEVFGLSNEDFEELLTFYNDLEDTI